MGDAEIRAALKTWREGLVGLTRRNRLIQFRAAKTSTIQIDSPMRDLIQDRLAKGLKLLIVGAQTSEDASRTPPPERDILRTSRADGDVGPVLRKLMREANEQFMDRGLSVLYLAFGILHWRDIDGSDMTSPVLLIPISLESDGPRSVPLLTAGEDETLLNPALTLRLKEFGLDLPAMDQIDGLPVSEVLAQVRSILSAAKDFAGWELRDAVYLATFSFSKEAMFKDLLDHENEILEHPIIRSLATSDPTKQVGEFWLDSIDVADIERIAPPEQTPLVLDADSSQRAAVAAALAGDTFVMDGPPGTGKSQTIANMIANLMHAGKTVLFVSEKMAALDVVRNRLNNVGLGSYLLELHSHKASRKEVVSELLKSLEFITVAPGQINPGYLNAAKDSRERLSDYAEAINEIREPLYRSLHSVLGTMAYLVDVQSVPLPDVNWAQLSHADCMAIQEVAEALARAWRPAREQASFAWRHVTEESPLEIRLYRAEQALKRLETSAELNTGLMTEFNLMKPSDAQRFAELLNHQAEAPLSDRIGPWLTTRDWNQVITSRTELRAMVSNIHAAESKVLEATGIPWSELPRPDQVPPSPGSVAARPAPIPLGGLGVSDLTATAASFEEMADSLAMAIESLSGLAVSMGLPEVRVLADAERVLRLVDIRHHERLIDKRWLSREGLAEARAASRYLESVIQDLRFAEEKAATTFTPDALQAPLRELQDRFANLHRGLRKLSRDYRADKRVVAGLLKSATDVKAGILRLTDAVEWEEKNRNYRRAADQYGPALGEYWRGIATDFEAFSGVLEAASEVVDLLDGDVSPPMINYLCSHGQPDHFRMVADAARASLDAWRSSLLPAPNISARPELLLGSFTESIAWLRAHSGAMRQAVRRIAAMESVTGRRHTLDETDTILSLVDNARRAHQSMRDREAYLRAEFGSHFELANTNLEAIDKALVWCNRLRVWAGGPLSPEQVRALSHSQHDASLTDANARWIEARNDILAAFAPSRKEELTNELDDYRGGREFINDLVEDSAGQREWFEFERACSTLKEHGLDAAIDFCIAERVRAEDVPRIIERALLRGWADSVIGGDSRLNPATSGDRDALVASYRDLDRRLIGSAVASIVESANKRRPTNTNIGEAALIRREGMKKRKHIPVRDLISQTRTTALAIKPVFMMSPLSVSQYLPSDISFDVVIFDEASQVSPGDAINCIYRGKSLILAGDENQLPPTSFFERNDEDTGNGESDVQDFQSILELAKGSGAFANMGLRWHYRSRHEDLIAFSNYKFYDGRLVTYPSSHSEGDDVGVAFYNAHGMYRRGGRADNPGEARVVADRVIDHFTNRPHLTLGVVTFSVAQATAVVDAIDAAREDRRDLDRFFDTENRLDGFFVRSLEAVQGDERDVIIFSIGYGPDEAGRVTTQFGVLNKEKGWRRLNVAITRARQRVELVASMTAGQIPPSDNENVEALRNYLDYAERGPAVLAVPYSSTGREPESPFEESVIKVIASWGYVVEPQVGAASYRIDIGVRHPEYPGMFAIGVECDGYHYHSAPAARDRDRLRDQVLTGLGWTLHRIWSTAWYRDRKPEENRLRSAIEAAIARPGWDRSGRLAAIERPEVGTAEVESDPIPTWTTSYVKAPLKRLPVWVDPAEAGSHLHMVEPLSALIGAEGPVHLSLIQERIRDWWDVGRVSARVRGNIDLALERASVVREGEFFSPVHCRIDRVRIPAESDEARKADHIHVDEISLAVEFLVRDAIAVERGELVKRISRLFGWARTGALVERRINEAIDRAVDRKRVVVQGDRLTIVAE